MELTEAQKKRLKGLAHSLNPVVMVGQHGLKDTILEEIGIAIEHHQLIKIKISVGDRDARDEIIGTISQKFPNALLIQRIGNVAVLYQRNKVKPYILSE